MSDYREFHALTDYQKQCLPASNYHRIKQGKKPIAIPEGETLPCVVGCGSAVISTNKPVIRPLNYTYVKEPFRDFQVVEKPVIRQKSYVFSIYEHQNEL